MTVRESDIGIASPSVASSYRFAFLLVTSLFFMWGLSYGLLDVLNKHFQETLNITRARSTLLQAAYFGAYFLLAMPAAAMISRFGYKHAILSGLSLFAIGALLVIPATLLPSFPFFVFAMFVIASGLAFLETAANPYVTLLGDPQHSTRRLNLSQSFNGLGQLSGPLLASYVLFSGGIEQASHSAVRGIYLVIAAIVVVLAVLTWRTQMPANPAKNAVASGGVSIGLWSVARFRWGVVAQFWYVAAQVGIGAFFLNYATEYQASLATADASRLLFVGLAMFLVGRFAGTALLSVVRPGVLLGTYGIINVILGCVVVAAVPNFSLIALIAMFFFMSIMFPTIFALAVKDLGEQTEKGSSYLIMSIVGGALVPPLMGWIADVHGTATAFLVPVVCFIVVAIYGWRLARTDV